MKRKLLIVAAAVCVIALLSVGTLALFSDSDSVTNKFMISSYKEDDDPVKPDEVFSVIVYETDKDGETTETGRTYGDIVPSGEYDKDPTVKNTGRYAQYIRVMVTVSNAKNWQAACARHEITDLTTIFGGFVEADWTRVDEPAYDAEKDELTYTYYYNGILEPGEAVTLFKTVTIPSAFDQVDMAALDYFELSVAADAIQSANTGDNAVEAFADCWGK